MYIYNDEFRIGSNVLVACTSVLIYDYIITLGQEVKYIWLKPWRFGTVLFMANRYLSFLTTFTTLYLEFAVVGPEVCKIGNAVATCLIALGLMVAETILLLRTLAIWKWKRKILYGLILMALSTFLIGIYLTTTEILSFKYKEVPPGGQGCFIASASKNILAPFVLIALSETVVVTLTWLKGREHLRSSKKSWVKRIYQDGLIFYIYLLIITIVNIIVPAAAPEPKYKNYLAVLQHLSHSVFCNRVILRIQMTRHMASKGQIEDEGTGLSRPRSMVNTMMTKTHLTTGGLGSGGNILDTGFDNNYAPTTTLGDRDLDIMEAPLTEEGEMHELSTMSYGRPREHGDWTRY